MKFFKKISAFLICAVVLLSVLPISAFAGSYDIPQINYSAHVSYVGWENSVLSGMTAGRTGANNKLEAIKLGFDNDTDLDVLCGVHVQNIGWMEEVSKGEIAGTVGKSLAIEGIYIYLRGEGAENFDIFYRVNVDKEGWLCWAKNGEPAGSEGFSLPVRQIEIKILSKGAFEDTESQKPAFLKTVLSYSAHMSNIGWMAEKNNGEIAGTEGKTNKLEAIKFNLKTKENVKLECGTHIQNLGWKTGFSSGDTAGTTGRSLAVEGFYAKLTGEDADKYDIWYRSDIEYFGWTSWTKNGGYSGGSGISAPIHAVEIKLCLKDKYMPEDTLSPFKTELFAYKAHMSGIGWMADKFSGETAGTADNSRSLEAVQIDALRGYGDLSVESDVHVQNIGWMRNIKQGSVVGTTGRSLSVEAISLKLKGAKKSEYDIYYKTYIKGEGWLSWAKNGEYSGSEGMSAAISAVKIVLCKKGTFTDGDDSLDFDCKISTVKEGYKDFSLTDTSVGESELSALTGIKANIKDNENLGISYTAHFSNIGWSEEKSNGEELSGSGNRIEAIKMRLNGADAEKYDIYYSACIKDYGWLGWAKNGEQAGSTGISYPIYALQIVIKEKDGFVPNFYKKSFVTTALSKPYIFAIDAGHGGIDSGARYGDRYERNDTEKVANEVVRILNAQGQKTYVTNRNNSAEQRGYELNSAKADFFVSIHRDSTDVGMASGISIYTHEPNHIQRKEQPSKTYAPNEQIDKHLLDDKLVNSLKSNLSGVSAIKVRGIYYGSASGNTYEDYYINRLTNMPGCIVELGYINNPADNAEFDAHYKDFAKAIAKSLMQTAGLTFDESKYTR